MSRGKCTQMKRTTRSGLPNSPTGDLRNHSVSRWGAGGRTLRAVVALFTFAGIGASAVMLAAPSGAAPTPRSEIDPTGGAACTNFYPELCLDESGGIDLSYFETTDGYLAAVSALERHRMGDDADGNQIPDSVELAVCGEAGCLPAWAENSTPTESTVLSIECCDGTFEPDVNRVVVELPDGFNPKKLVSAFSLSTPHVHYFGAYPASGTVTFAVDGPDLSVGTHRFVVVGTSADSAAAKVAIWKVDVAREAAAAAKAATVTKTSSGAAGAPTSTRPVARTGSNLRSLMWAGAGLLLLGYTVVALNRRRLDRRYY